MEEDEPAPRRPAARRSRAMERCLLCMTLVLALTQVVGDAEQQPAVNSSAGQQGAVNSASQQGTTNSSAETAAGRSPRDVAAVRLAPNLLYGYVIPIFNGF